MSSKSSMLFKGTNVFLSRSLVAPEIFDALHDALRLNGAYLFLCCDPSRSSPNDFHVISSSHHEKFEDLRSKGCKLLGPQCIFSCAKERIPLPNQGYTCCLAMDGVKVLASGFDTDEKATIEKLVTAMGGIFLTKASPDVSFVIAKNVLASKYKWASNVLKRPIVTMSWLQHCWDEHCVVPQEPYRILPFAGLVICATRIPADIRKEMERLIIANGGQYSADLTRKCTHLVSDVPEGDKYVVARRWGHIRIVCKKWFDQSIQRRACLDEEMYPVVGSSVSAISGKSGFKGDCVQHKSITTSQSVHSNIVIDREATPSQSTCSTNSDATIFAKVRSQTPSLPAGGDGNFGGCVAHDSQSEQSDLYLSDCRILFVGFQASEIRKLVNMVRNGGGTRHMAFSEKLTHIIVGAPTEAERKEIRRYASWGVIHVVRTVWLEDCDRDKKEIAVSERHIFSESVPKAVSTSDTRQERSSNFAPDMPTDKGIAGTNLKAGWSMENTEKYVRDSKISTAGDNVEVVTRSDDPSKLNAVKESKLQCFSGTVDAHSRKLSNVFKGRLFSFSNSFPVDRRDEIVEWIIQGGGKIVNDDAQNAHFIVECHGVRQIPSNASQSTIVSSHWIRFSLEEGTMPAVDSHILYSPLPCHIPLPGFEGLKFCISQYEEKDRMLLRNLCHILGAKFTEKLTKKVTHLLCKFTSGPKYDAACKWGIEPVTAEWITECIRQDTVVSPHPFRPKVASAQDQEAGLCTISQYLTQAAHMVLGDLPSQLPHEPQSVVELPAQIDGMKGGCFKRGENHSSAGRKRARHSEDDSGKDLFPMEGSIIQDVTGDKMCSMKKSILEDCAEGPHTVPDVAAAIEDLLAQSSKIQDMMSPESNGCDRSIFSPDRSILGQDHSEPRATFGMSKHWPKGKEKQDDNSNLSERESDQRNYDSFTETQIENQVVGYEEDLSGRQMIIERFRTRSTA